MATLTKAARMAWEIGAAEAARLRHPFIEREHLLIGLCSLPKILQYLGYTHIESLPVDLCFRVDFQIQGTETIVPGNELVVFAGDARGSYFSPSNFRDVPAFREHANKDGFVDVRVILSPSQALALTHPHVKSYYPAPITSDVVRVRVDYDVATP